MYNFAMHTVNCSCCFLLCFATLLIAGFLCCCCCCFSASHTYSHMHAYSQTYKYDTMTRHITRPNINKLYCVPFWRKWQRRRSGGSIYDQFCTIHYTFFCLNFGCYKIIPLPIILKICILKTTQFRLFALNSVLIHPCDIEKKHQQRIFCMIWMCALIHW